MNEPRRPQLFTACVIALMAGWLVAVPAAHAADLTASSQHPTVVFSDSDVPGFIWQLQGNAGAAGAGSVFSLYDFTSTNVAIQVNSSANNHRSLYVDSSGDVHLAEGALVVERSTGFVGIGTVFNTNPQANLHIYGGATEDAFSGIGPSPTSGPAFNFGYSGNSFGRGSGFFNVRPDNLAVAPNPSLRFATANVQRMIITNTGNVGIGATSPTHPLQMGSGARVTAGGVWTDASSREYKQDIQPLTPEEARVALASLAPVKFAYKADPAEHHVGFVAEDVPALLATADRQGLSPMDIVAVLTRVVQEQQRAMEEERRATQAALAKLEAEVAALRQATSR